MKFKIKNNKGISLATVIISIILMIIILSSIMLSKNETSETKEAMQINNDIEELTRRVNLYYFENGTLPIDEETIEEIDGKPFYRLLISTFENLKLRNKEELDESGTSLKKGYVINKETHLIYYVENGEAEKYKYSEEYEEFLEKANVSIKQVSDTTKGDVSSGEIFTFEPNSDGYTLKGLTKYGRELYGFKAPKVEEDDLIDLVIPKYYKGKPVTRIGNYINADDGKTYGAFQNCNKIKSVDLENVNYIINGVYDSYGAFYGCTKLKSIDLSNITHIGTAAFISCSALENVIITNTTESLGNYVFKDCTSLRTIYLYVGRIRPGVFYGCSSLASIVASNVKQIDSRAFYGCTGLTQIEISKSCTIIGEYIFNDTKQQLVKNIKIYCPGKTDTDGNNIPDVDENNTYENWNKNWAYGVEEKIKWNESMPTS